jgi:hypothetical protein
MPSAKPARSWGTFQLDGCDLYTSCDSAPCAQVRYLLARLLRLAPRLMPSLIGFGTTSHYEELDRPMESRKLPMTQCCCATMVLAGSRPDGTNWKAKRNIKVIVFIPFCEETRSPKNDLR